MFYQDMRHTYLIIQTGLAEKANDYNISIESC